MLSLVSLTARGRKTLFRYVGAARCGLQIGVVHIRFSGQSTGSALGHGFMKGGFVYFYKKLICNHHIFLSEVLCSFIMRNWQFSAVVIFLWKLFVISKWPLNKAGRSSFSDFSLSLCRTNIAMIGRCRPCTFPSFYVLFGTVALPLCPVLILKKSSRTSSEFSIVFCWFLLKFSLRERVWRSRRRSFRFTYSYFTRLSERIDSCP